VLRPVWISALTLVVFAVGCNSGKTPAPAPTIAARPTQAPAKSGPPPTPKRDVHFKTADGEMLAGELYLAADHSAPAVVLVHRQDGSQSEFKPLVQRLAKADKRFTLLAFDRRGSGASPPPLHPGKLDPGELGSQDVQAAIHEVLEESGGRARGVVLVGSSLGAALVSRVAYSEPKVTALALISPAAAIDGVDVYHPYAQVRNLPTFLAASSDDIISRSPMDALAHMAMAGTVKRYSGRYHSAKLLGDAHPELWKDLEAWLMGEFDEKPMKRQSLYYAPGKEPGAKARRLDRAPRKMRAGGAGK
jgi:pimeloyl-ACP methyl ester carboxylesterase